MSNIAIIGGSGLAELPDLQIVDKIEIETPWGKPSAPITITKINEFEVMFLPRHGNPHTIPPHKVNYRANLWALNENNVSEIIAVNAVGGITQEMSPCSIVIPDQLIDYTHGRADSFHEENLAEVKHIDFTNPYSESLRQKLINAAADNKLDIVSKGSYAVTQGPRLETAAEVSRLEKDGNNIVGMTSMPEASLARELGIEYVCCALVVNWAAGKTDEIITMEIIENNLSAGLGKIQSLIARFINNKK